ncbi:hypothetical protein QCA50_002554 [Cerrena zonata]|uniref:DUF6533 domain-containing protein n=1 Tax=Cerrena zonata TaxID=2478898 RepID=A0AAW0GRU3_9APHY
MSSVNPVLALEVPSEEWKIYVWDAQLSRLTYTACLAIAVYDYFLTLDDEMSLIWNSQRITWKGILFGGVCLLPSVSGTAPLIRRH